MLLYFSLWIDTPLSGAAKGLFEGGKEYFKQNPADAIEMGKNIADILKIKPEQGIAFATEFMKTAFLKWACRWYQRKMFLQIEQHCINRGNDLLKCQ